MMKESAKSVKVDLFQAPPMKEELEPNASPLIKLYPPDVIRAFNTEMLQEIAWTALKQRSLISTEMDAQQDLSAMSVNIMINVTNANHAKQDRSMILIKGGVLHLVQWHFNK